MFTASAAGLGYKIRISAAGLEDVSAITERLAGSEINVRQG
jgi:hypothetical protein